jgi:transposase
MCNLPESHVKRILEENKQLQEKVNQIPLLLKRIEELEKLLKIHDKIHDNPNTPPSQKRFPPRRPPLNGKPGRKKGHEGVTRESPAPDRTVPLTAKRCPRCKARLRHVGQSREVIEDIPPVQQKIVTEFLINHYHCDNCGEDVIPTHPNLPKEGRFGNNLLSQVTLLKFQERLPLRKIRSLLMRNHAISISIGTLLDITNRAAKAVRVHYSQILHAVRNAAYIYADETSIKVNGKRWWIWIFVTETEVFCIVSASRGKKVLKALDGFRGILICDGWKAYRGFAETIQRCWAHLLREADYLGEHVSEAKKLAAELHLIFNECKDFLEGNPAEKERTQFNEAMKARMSWLLQLPFVTEAMRKFVKKIQNGFDHWFTFLLHPEIEPTNNNAERALREHVVIRKIIGTLRNEKGTHIHETLMTVFQTWEQQGSNTQEQLMGALMRRS